MSRMKQTMKALGSGWLHLMLVGMVALAACTKDRPEKFLDGPNRDEPPLEKSLFTKPVTIQTSGATYNKTRITQSKIHAMNLKDFVQVASHDAHPKIAFMFEDLYVPAAPNSTYEVQLEIDREYVQAYLITHDLNDLPLLYQEPNLTTLVPGSSPKNPTYRTSIFQYRITVHGNVVRAKNDLEERTNVLRVQRTNNWQDGAYIQLSAQTAEARELTGLDPASQNQLERVFISESLDGMVTNREEIHSNMSIDLGVNQDDVIYTKVESNKLIFFKVTTSTDPLLTIEEKRIIDAGVVNQDIRECTPETAALVELAAGEKCIHLYMYDVAVKYVEPERIPVDEYEGLQSRIRFTAVLQSKNSKYIEVARDPKPEWRRKDASVVGSLDPRDYLLVNQFRDKTFQMRRMISEVPNSLNLFFVTQTGPIQLVKFRFKPDRIEVYRVDPTDRGGVNSEVDLEVVMSIPVNYFKAVNYDERGYEIEYPRLIPADYKDTGADIYARVNWTGNRIGNTGSPMSNYFEGQCFSNSSTEIYSVENRLGESGVFNFSLEGTYSLNPANHLACTGRWAGASAFNNIYGGDGNFQISERFSFRVHDHANDEFQTLDMPIIAQKAFNFMAITRSAKDPKPSGDWGQVGTQRDFAVIHNFAAGKQTLYVLAGVPENYRLRDEVIAATREVIADWNKTLRMAFKGTPLESKFPAGRDPLILKINGVDIDSTVGDLDVNHIYFDASSTANGYLGVYMGTPNTRSGLYEAGNVAVFAGNAIRHIDYLKWAAQIRQDYVDRMKLRHQQGLAQLKSSGALQTPATTPPAGGGAGAANPDLGSPDTFENLEEFSAFLQGAPQLDALAELKGMSEPVIHGHDGAAWSQDLAVRFEDLIQYNPSEVQELKSAYGIEVRGEQLISRRGTAGISDVAGLLERGIRDGILESDLASELWYQKAIDAAMNGAAKKGLSKRGFEEAMIDAYLEAHHASMPANESLELKARLMELRVWSLHEEGLVANQQPHCFFEVPELEDQFILDKTEDELFISFYKHTTSHELGHALGLMHNFQGSYDGKNFEFPGENTGRLSSSIMEYGTVDERGTYRGPGPYDVHALRAMYTGMVELDPAFASSWVKKDESGNTFIPLQGAQMPVYGGKFVKMDDIKDVFLPNKNWYEIDELEVSRLPVKFKHYAFCTNRFEWYDPTCNTFDKGTTGEEIVQHYIDSYRANYEFIQMPHDRINFTVRNWLGANSFASYNFFRMRRFMDEVMFRLIANRGMGWIGQQDQSKWSYEDARTYDFILASAKAHSFFLHVIHTPDASPYDTNESRMLPLIFKARDANGNTKDIVEVVEKKWLYTYGENDYGRYSKIGIYLDKVAASNFLTRRLPTRIIDGDPSVPSRFSFIDFERIFFGVQNPMESPTILALGQILTEDLQPMFIGTGTNAYSLNLGMNYTADTSSMMRFYGAVNAVLNLYVDTIEQGFNYGSHFRVGSAEGVPSWAGPDFVSVVDLGVPEDHPSERRYYSVGGDQSILSTFLVGATHQMRELLDTENKRGIAEAIDRFVIEVIPALKSGVTDMSQVDPTSTLGLAIADLSTALAKVYSTQDEVDAQINLATQYTLVTLQVAAAYQQLAGNGNHPEAYSLVEQVENMNKRFPMIGLVTTSLNRIIADQAVTQQLGLNAQLMGSILPNDPLRFRFGYLKSNLDLMNRLYALIEPSARNK